jgi:hypothetical protein
LRLAEMVVGARGGGRRKEESMKDEG